MSSKRSIGSFENMHSMPSVPSSTGGEIQMKWILGSANFGLSYGIANGKKLSRAQVFDILQTAQSQRVWGIDTAQAYGDAETVIGEYFKEQSKRFRIITKLSSKVYQDSKEVEKEITDSLRAMNIDSIDVLLLHSYETYRQSGKVILPVLQALWKEKVIGRYGLSVYHPEEAIEAAGDFKEALTIEFPINLFDRRFLKGCLLERLNSEGTFLLARSVFLQGLFFMKGPALQGDLRKVKKKVEAIAELAEKANLRPEWLPLTFVATQPWVDGVVIGVDSADHLRVNLQALTKENLARYREIEDQLADLEVEDEAILLPYRWER
ncbi:MAG: aldo/keto reductase [Candidatus Manganitrophaceae bacterium]|nr:MAG: aldo/keto reductase [Candidatus Manganitrophaceae bacterium]